jgi:hypothetical protein
MVSPSVIGVGDYSQSQADLDSVNRVLPGVSLNLAPLVESAIIEYTIPPGYRWRSLGGSLGGNGVGRFQIWKDGALVDIKRSSYFQRTVNFPSGLQFFAGEVLRVIVRNDSIVEEANDYEAFLYFREELI